MGVATSGLLADGRHLVHQARDECHQYRDMYRTGIRAPMLAERVGMQAQAYTLYSSVRPYAVTATIASMDAYDGPQLYQVESSGLYFVHSTRVLVFITM